MEAGRKRDIKNFVSCTWLLRYWGNIARKDNACNTQKQGEREREIKFKSSILNTQFKCNVKIN